MKRHPLVTVAGVMLLIALTAFAVELANGGEKQNKKPRLPKTEIVPSRLSDSSEQIEYMMQWNDARKRLLFDGKAIRHDDPTYCLDNLRGYNYRGSMARLCEFTSAPTQPDPYSFHVDKIGELGNPAETKRHYGRIDFHLQWDEAANRFVAVEPEPELPFHFDFCLGGYYR